MISWLGFSFRSATQAVISFVALAIGRGVSEAFSASTSPSRGSIRIQPRASSFGVPSGRVAGGSGAGFGGFVAGLSDLEGPLGSLAPWGSSCPAGCLLAPFPDAGLSAAGFSAAGSSARGVLGGAALLGDGRRGKGDREPDDHSDREPGAL